MHERKTRGEVRNRWIYNYSWGLKHPTSSNRQKIKKDIEELDNTFNKDLIGIYRKLYSLTAEYTFFFQVSMKYSSRQSISSAVRQTSTNWKELKSYTAHNGIILEINNRKAIGQSPKPCKLNNTLRNTPRFKEEIPKEIKNL